PHAIAGEAGQVRSITFEQTEPGPDGRLKGLGKRFTLPADIVFTAIGQIYLPDPLVADTASPINLQDGAIAVNDDRQTSLPDVFAGGDCVPGVDLTVQAVEDGKQAAMAIDRQLHGRAQNDQRLRGQADREHNNG
ncbi:MAG: FAD-dependent oxidoreductase, partial [Alphaproteobacteria bacterium]